MMLCSQFNNRVQTFLRDYDRIQSFSIILIYIQIGCGMIGSLGALYNGICLINVGISLFALVAIESSSQRLGRIYALLLFFAVLLDVFWFILFSHEIWYMSSQIYGNFVIFSVKLTLLMQIIGFLVRLSSSVFWIQMYRLGSSSLVDGTYHQDGDQNSFINPATPNFIRHDFGSEDVIGGSVYDPAYYSSFFQDNQGERSLRQDENRFSRSGRSISDVSQLMPSGRKSLQAIIHEEDAQAKHGSF
ncbi:hypothetical protein CTI12_AA527860 [Artemisia annua]|uniref:Transmembrane protein n=1 Tax=Artemisia annua TaxID=35608 RepID=A0A2U1L5K5_ARTAN|nr:hypothetical protein CTI12_AA527860 [Artemisia annua]